MTKFRYSLDSSEKIDCPQCRHRGRFVRFRDVVSGEFLSDDYGRCDRVNSCGYSNSPVNSVVKNDADIKHHLQREKHITYSSVFSEKYYNNYLKNTHKFAYEHKPRQYKNVFLRGLVERFGKEKVLKVKDELRLGTFYDGAVMFPYFNHDNELITAKAMFYDDNLKRVKDGKKSYPRWLHNYEYKTDDGHELVGWNDELHVCDLPFFGWNLEFLLKNNKTVGLVESEKTAIILRILVPEIFWMATGGINNLQEHKFLGLNNKNWVVLPDLGFMPNNKTTVKEWWQKKFDELKHKIDFKSVLFPDYVPDASAAQKQIWESNGYDIADFILSDNHYRNNIKKILKIEK